MTIEQQEIIYKLLEVKNLDNWFLILSILDTSELPDEWIPCCRQVDLGVELLHFYSHWKSSYDRMKKTGKSSIYIEWNQIAKFNDENNDILTRVVDKLWKSVNKKV